MLGYDEQLIPLAKSSHLSTLRAQALADVVKPAQAGWKNTFRCGRMRRQPASAGFVMIAAGSSPPAWLRARN
jgi:hypothetical protein